MSTKSLSRRNNGGFTLSSSLNDFFQPWSGFFDEPALTRAFTTPAVNITENEKQYELSLAAPGLEKDDFNIEVEGNVISISAEKEQQKDDNSKEYSRQEYNYSSFSRSFTLPASVKKEDIDAEYKDGVLMVVLPKNESTIKASKKVKIR